MLRGWHDYDTTSLYAFVSVRVVGQVAISKATFLLVRLYMVLCSCVEQAVKAVKAGPSKAIEKADL